MTIGRAIRLGERDLYITSIVWISVLLAACLLLWSVYLSRTLKRCRRERDQYRSKLGTPGTPSTAAPEPDADEVKQIIRRLVNGAHVPTTGSRLVLARASRQETRTLVEYVGGEWEEFRDRIETRID